MIIDATDLILGRLASIVAKRALLAEEVQVINCEKAIVTGDRQKTLEDSKKKAEMGSSTRGPFTRRRPDRFVKRAIRGMLPYKKESGRKALDRIRCYIGVPDSLKDKKYEKIKNADISKLKVMKYTTVKEICKTIGGKL